MRARKENIEHDNRNVTRFRRWMYQPALAALHLLSVMFINQGYIPAMGEEHAPFYIKLLREFVLVAIILLSLKTTSKEIRRANHYSWAPIVEVAVLFVGIFATMTPALIYLNAHAPSMGLDQPWAVLLQYRCAQFVPRQCTYGRRFPSVAVDCCHGGYAWWAVARNLLEGDICERRSSANTYIGKVPTLGKAIAEESGIKMPSFFGYMVKFSLNCIAAALRGDTDYFSLIQVVVALAAHRIRPKLHDIGFMVQDISYAQNNFYYYIEV